MCGIAGLFQPVPYIPDRTGAERAVRRMNDRLAHRGPDAEGTWADPKGRCVLGNRRLRVQDLSDAGNQPMLSHDGRWAIAFNGEIYNARELREQLPAAPGGFRGHSDTEVLVNALAAWGLDCLGRLDGMFAFAAFNLDTGEFIAARDPFGEKPLYFQELPSACLAFASELTALESLPGFDGRVSRNAMAEYLMFEYVGAPRSIYRNVRKLKPGHFLRQRPGKSLEVERYFEFRPGRGETTDRSCDDLADELEELLVKSLRRRMVSDVPLGALLSGGVDSSTVCALLRRKLNVPLSTFSAGFSGSDDSEHATARLFADHLGTDHHEHLLHEGAIGLLGRMGRLLDEPCADWSCLPVYLLSEFARRSVTVAISGDGGDELFAGYDRYGTLLDDTETRTVAESDQAGPGSRYYNWGLLALGDAGVVKLFGAMPSRLGSHLHALRSEIDQGQVALIHRMRKSDVENYLPGAVLTKVDRMSMQHSLEVRTPFLNVEIARFAERLPPRALYRAGQGKRVLRTLAYRYLPKESVDLPKKGFGLPSLDWARESISQTARNTLLSDDSRLAAFFGYRRLRELLDRPKAVHRWWSMTVLESWLRHHPATLPEPDGDVRA